MAHVEFDEEKLTVRVVCNTLKEYKMTKEIAMKSLDNTPTIDISELKSQTFMPRDLSRGR